jgi:hypothetical protein
MVAPPALSDSRQGVATMFMASISVGMSAQKLLICLGQAQREPRNNPHHYQKEQNFH